MKASAKKTHVLIIDFFGILDLQAAVAERLAKVLKKLQDAGVLLCSCSDAVKSEAPWATEVLRQYPTFDCSIWADDGFTKPDYRKVLACLKDVKEELSEEVVMIMVGDSTADLKAAENVAENAKEIEEALGGIKIKVLMAVGFADQQALSFLRNFLNFNFGSKTIEASTPPTIGADQYVLMHNGVQYVDTTGSIDMSAVAVATIEQQINDLERLLREGFGLRQKTLDSVQNPRNSSSHGGGYTGGQP